LDAWSLNPCTVKRGAWSPLARAAGLRELHLQLQQEYRWAAVYCT